MRGVLLSVCRDRQTALLSAITLYSAVEMSTTLDGPAVIDPYWSKIEIFAPVRDPRRNIAITFSTEKKNDVATRR